MQDVTPSLGRLGSRAVITLCVRSPRLGQQQEIVLYKAVVLEVDIRPFRAFLEQAQPTHLPQAHQSARDLAECVGKTTVAVPQTAGP